jgi:hypothetical protein
MKKGKIMKKTHDQQIRKSVVDGYMRALDIAETNEVGVDEFKNVLRELLLGLFMSVNEIGMDHLPPDVRVQDLKNNFDVFAINGMSSFAQHIIDDANNKLSKFARIRAMRLCNEKNLTNQTRPSEDESRFETGEQNEK